jgi:hypothetical protein
MSEVCELRASEQMCCVDYEAALHGLLHETHEHAQRSSLHRTRMEDAMDTYSHQFPQYASLV